MGPVSPLLVACAFVCVAILLRHVWLLFRFRHIPGPWALPLVGHVLMPGAISSPIRLWSAIRKRYGRIAQFWPGPTPWLLITDAAASRQVLSDTEVFAKSDSYRTAFALPFGEGLVTSSGQKHKRDRNTFSRFFVKASVETRVATMNALTMQRMRETFDVAAAAATTTTASGGVMDTHDFFHFLTLRVFGQFALNYDFSQDAELERFVVDRISWGSWAVGFLCLTGQPLWSFLPPVGEVMKLTKTLCDVFLRIYDARVEQTARGEPTPDDILQTMITAKLPRKEVTDHLMTMVSAGHDTTAYFGCYMTYLLAQHPQVQERVREEVRAVMGDREEVTPEDVSNMRYMRKVMQETLRLYAVIPNLQRVTTEDVVLKESGHFVPKDTIVFIPLSVMNRDPDVWDQPNEFNPDRFEGIESNSAKHGYLPFGYGSRTCIGNTLAIIEATVMFAHLLRHYRFEPDPTHPLRISSGISLTSEGGVWVTVRRL